GGGCQLLVTNGGVLTASALSIGTQTTASNNRVVITGNGSSVTNTFQTTVGDKGSNNRLDLRDGALLVSSGLRIGVDANSSNNVVAIIGGNYRIRPSSASPLEVRHGSFVISNGGGVAA